MITETNKLINILTEPFGMVTSTLEASKTCIVTRTGVPYTTDELSSFDKYGTISWSAEWEDPANDQEICQIARLLIKEVAHALL